MHGFYVSGKSVYRGVKSYFSMFSPLRTGAGLERNTV